MRRYIQPFQAVPWNYVQNGTEPESIIPLPLRVRASRRRILRRAAKEESL